MSQSSQWIEKTNSENEKGEVFINIENYRNIIKKIKFKFIRSGITIIIGKNNVGKTNILDYIYDCPEKWNGFDDNNFKKPYKYLPLFFGNNKPILFEKNEKILSDIRANSSSWPVGFWNNERVSTKELKFKYFYKIFYLDLKTFFNFLYNDFETNEMPKKIKIGGCSLKFLENYDENNLRKKVGLNSLTWGEKIKRPEEKWNIRYPKATKGINRLSKDNATNETIYKGVNESIDEEKNLPISTTGSGYLKFKKIETLINSLIENYIESPSDEIYREILLIDEPELLLHPPLITSVSNFLKRLKEKNLTIILSTHSPALLSQFAYDDNVNFAVVKSGKDKKEFLLEEIVYFWDIVEEARESIEETWKNYCDCLKSWTEVKGDKFYLDHWKSLLNEHTLKVFFSEEILFVEGISDYILFTSELLKKEVPKLRKIQVIPIFGKSNYIFFYELTKRLHLKCWFLLDMDKHDIDKKIIQKDLYEEQTLTSSYPENENKSGNCTREKLHTQFFLQHKGNLKNFAEIKDDEIFHSKESRISWFPENMENFLLKEKDDASLWGKHHWKRKETRILGNISLDSFVEERFEKLKESLGEIIKWIEKQRYSENLPLLR